mmetsp:Transcript_46813/g.111377  ORF Transcript_46813/g.111377 Transcript_46813/m.111377 type:complete len:158 (-) Transcript_46813:1642-2115(-)
MRASTLSMSKWFVGSSRIRISGLLQVILAKQTRAFCPPESSFIGRRCAWDGKPNCPKHLCANSGLSVPAPKRRSSGEVRNSTADICRAGAISSKCCEYRPTTRPRLCTISPEQGSETLPTRLRSVDFPAPFGPTTTTRIDESTRKLRSESSQGFLPL